MLGGKGSDGLAPARRKAEVDFPLGVQRGLKGALKSKEELLLKFRPKRQYQPQVTHLSFVYCLYYVNTFFGKYFCFYFIIKFRNLTRRMVASLARGVFSGSALSGAERASWWGRRGGRCRGARAPPPCPVWSGHVGALAGPVRGSRERRGELKSPCGSGEPRAQGKTGGEGPEGSEEVGHLLPEGTALQAAGFSAPVSACPGKKPPSLSPPRLEGGWANRAWPDHAPGSSTAGLQTPFRSLRE